MYYNEYTPSPVLAPYVRCCWVLTGSAPEAAQPPERVLPDGCIELIIHFGEPFKRHHRGTSEQQPRSFIVGQITGPFFLEPTGTVGVLGVRFRPGGAHPFVGVPLSELQNSSITLDELWSSFGRELEATVLKEQTVHGKIQAVQNALERKLRSTKQTNSYTTAIAEAITNANGTVNLRELSKHTGMSARHIERTFNAHVGMPPKLLARILRFQHVFTTLEHSVDGTWVSAAFACGYYDQAHLIRDFKQFAGVTPSEFSLQQFELARHFLPGNRMSHFSKTPR